MKLRKTPEGKIYLHVWRTGTAYESQNKLLYRNEWTNIKFSVLPFPSTEYVLSCDIRRPLPYPDSTFDAVYTNHVLEHLTPEEGRFFASELFRVLKPGCICRVVVPDLERNCREYLKCLEDCLSNPTEKNIQKHRWAVLDLIDQMIRDKSGGEMLSALKKGDFDAQQVKRTSGDVFDQFLPGSTGEETPADAAPVKQGLLKKLFSSPPRQTVYSLWRAVKLFLYQKDPRKTREANKWMYDRVSLRLLLESRGFDHFSIKDHKGSAIENWQRYNFDKSINGDYPLEPSLYVECVKP